MNTPFEDEEQARILRENKDKPGCWAWLVVGCIWAGIFASWLLV